MTKYLGTIKIFKGTPKFKWKEAKLQWHKECLYAKGISIWSMSREHIYIHVYIHAFDTNARFPSRKRAYIISTPLNPFFI